MDESELAGSSYDSYEERVTLPDELVQAAAEALWHIGNERIGHRKWDSVSSHYMTEATAALQAAFAKLSECFKAEVTGDEGDRHQAIGWNDCLAALARAFGSQEAQ